MALTHSGTLPTRPLGRSNIPVTIVGLGGAPIGNQFGEVLEAEATATLEAAWSCGIRYFDKAPMYGCGLAEHRYGRMLRDRHLDEYVLSSKVGRLLRPSQAGRGRRLNFENTLGRCQTGDAAFISIGHGTGERPLLA